MRKAIILIIMCITCVTVSGCGKREAAALSEAEIYTAEESDEIDRDIEILKEADARGELSNYEGIIQTIRCVGCHNIERADVGSMDGGAGIYIDARTKDGAGFTVHVSESGIVKEVTDDGGGVLYSMTQIQ